MASGGEKSNGLLLVEKGEHYWVYDPKHEFIPVQIVEIDNVLKPEILKGQVASLSRAGELSYGAPIRVSIKNVMGLIPSPAVQFLNTNPDDLVDKDDISEASILWTLEKRFAKLVPQIYTSIGPIIVAINPYRKIPSLFSEDNLNNYLRNVNIYNDSNSSPNKNKSSPHVWTIAANSYSSMSITHKNQAIIISGESGAGKTETAKLCLQFLSSCSQLFQSSSSSSSSSALTIGQPSQSQSQSQSIESIVIETNPLLESFGNAKTDRNNNSSRFGKWLTVNFVYKSVDSRQFYQIVGAHITQFLLEKSRVVSHGENERNYHIFYQICASERWDPKSFNYLMSAGSTTIDKVDDLAEFNVTDTAFDKLNFHADHSTAIKSVLKAILYLGNISFENEEDASRKCSVSTSSEQALSLAAQYLSLTPESLSKALTTKYMKGRNETIEMSLDAKDATNIRNVFAKELYNRLFNNIVDQINLTLQPKNTSTNNTFIGLLDVFGFEIFTYNSFEQLCINYANEKLQHYFVNYVIQREQQIYEDEGIQYTRVLPRDNADVLELMEAKPHGIFSRLDEELKLPKGSDDSFLKKVADFYNPPTPKGVPAAAYAVVQATSRFQKSIKLAVNEFDVVHFAGKVRYNCTGFLDKNKDKLFDHCDTVLSTCSSIPIRQLLKVASEEGVKAVSLSNKFQSQLHELMNILAQSEAHFIRCIKPNVSKSYEVFEHKMVLGQLQYSGVLDAIQIRKSGFPVRRSLQQFISSFWMTTDKNSVYYDSYPSKTDAVNSLIAYAKSNFTDESYNSTQIQVGNTIVFFNPVILADLEKRRNLALGPFILKLQCFFRRAPLQFVRFPRMLAVTRRIVQLMEVGELDNRTNDTVLPELESLCDESHGPLRLKCFLLKDADALVARLKLVKKMKDAVILFSEKYQLHLNPRYNVVQSVMMQGDRYEVNEHNVSSVFNVRDEVERGKGILTWSESFDCTEFLMKENFGAMFNTMQRCSLAIDNVKISLTFGVELAVESAIHAVTELFKTVGCFHIDEVNLAMDFLALLRAESKSIDTNLEEINRIKSYRSVTKEGSGSTGGGSNVTTFSSSYNVNEFKMLLETAITQMQASLSVFEPEKITCNINRFLINNMKCIFSIFQKWKDDDCSQILDQLQDIIENVYLVYSRTKSVEAGTLSNIFELIPIQDPLTYNRNGSINPSSQGEALKIPESITHTSRMQLLNLIKCTKFLLKIIEKDIYFHKAVPLIYNALSHMKKSIVDLANNSNKLSFSKWQDEVNNIKQFQVNSANISNHNLHNLLGSQDEVIEEDDEIEDAILLFHYFVLVFERYHDGKIDEVIELIFKDPTSMKRAYVTVLRTVQKLQGGEFEDPNKIWDMKAELTGLAEGIGAGAEGGAEGGESGSKRHSHHHQSLQYNTQSVFVPTVNPIDLEFLNVWSKQEGRVAEIEKISEEERYILLNSNKLAFILHGIVVDLSKIRDDVTSKYVSVLCNLSVTFLSTKLFSIEEIHHDFEHIEYGITALDTSIFSINDIKDAIKISDSSGFLLTSLSLLLQLRLKVRSKEWLEGASYILENKLIALSANDEKDLFTSTLKTYTSFSELDKDVISSMMYECSCIYEICQFEVIKNSVFDTLKIGEVTGTVNALTYNPEVSFESVSKSIADIQEEINKFSDRNSDKINQQSHPLCDILKNHVSTLTKLLQVGHQLIKTRQEFKFKESLTNKQQEMSKLNDCLAAADMVISPSLLQELKIFNLCIEHDESLLQMKSFLVWSTPVTYLASIRPQSPSGGYEQGVSEGILNLLADENLTFEDSVMDTSKMKGVLLASSAFLGRMRKMNSNADLMEYKLINDACNNLCHIRDYIKLGNWEYCFELIQDINSNNLRESVPQIEAELVYCEKFLSVYSSLSKCRDNLSKVYLSGSGDIGIVNLNLIDLELSNECAQLMADITDVKFSKLFAQYQAVTLYVKDLRTNLKQKNWSSLKEILKNAESVKAENPTIFKYISQEVIRVQIEADCINSINEIKAALVNEAIIPAVQSNIESAAVKIDALTSALKSANSLTQKNRGSYLAAYMDLSDYVLKIRKFVMQNQWPSVENLLPGYNIELTGFSDISRSLDVIRRKHSKKMNPKSPKTNALGTVFHDRGSDDEDQEEQSISSNLQNSMQTIKNTRASYLTAIPPKSKGRHSSVLNTITSEPLTPKADLDNESNNDDPNSIANLNRPVVDALKKEMEVIGIHLAEKELENEILESFSQGKIQTDILTGAIEQKDISFDGISTALAKKEKLENLKHIKLSDKVDHLTKTANLIKEIRTSVMNNKWDLIPGLLEGALMAGSKYQIPEVVRQELTVIRNEVENRWIIDNITTSYNKGKLEGNPGEINLSKVSASALDSSIIACKAVGARSDMARLFISTAEAMLPIRKMVSSDNIDWDYLHRTTTALLSKPKIDSLHQLIIPEVKLINVTAEDKILCMTLLSAISLGSLTGKPGKVDISHVSVKGLDSAIKMASMVNLATDKARHLLNACKLIKTIRENIIITQTQPDTDQASYAWNQIYISMNAIQEDKQHGTQLSGWQASREEISLFNREGDINRVKDFIIFSMNQHEKIYLHRNALSMQQLNNKSFKKEDVTIHSSDLQDVLAEVNKFEFTCDLIKVYQQSINYLITLRDLLIAKDWKRLEEMIKTLEKQPDAPDFHLIKKEYGFICQDYRGQICIDQMKTALREKQTNPEVHLTHLRACIEQIELFKFPTVAVKEFLDCTKQIWLLRRGLCDQNSDTVVQALKWFKANQNICPEFIQSEAESAYVQHQNNLLESGLRRALSDGKANFQRSRINYTASIEVGLLKKLITQASEVKSLRPSVCELLESAKLIYEIRSAQRMGDFVAIQKVIDNIEKQDTLHPLILEEVHNSKSDLENERTINLLVNALKTFDENSTLFYPSVESSISLSLKSPISKTSSFSKEGSGKEGGSKNKKNSYSLANIANPNIDVDTIDIASLDSAINEAKSSGIFSEDAIRLYKTVHLVRNLRHAVKTSNWAKVEDLLLNVNKDSFGKNLDIMAEKEILVIQHQLGMRSTVLDIAKALESGSAQCHNGIVNNSQKVAVRNLKSSIESAILGIEKIRLDQEGNSKEKDKSTLEIEIETLVQSSIKICEVREALVLKDVQKASELVVQAFSGGIHELTKAEFDHYKREIVSVLFIQNIGTAIEHILDHGNVQDLKAELEKAHKLKLHLTHDLGLIKVLHNASIVYRSYYRFRKEYKELLTSYDTPRMEKFIADAKKSVLSNRIDGAFTNKIFERIERIKAFEKRVSEEGETEFSENYHETLAQIARQCGFMTHPFVAYSKRTQCMSSSGRRTASIVNSILHRKFPMALDHTISHKIAYHALLENKHKFHLYQFPKLRNPKSYFIDHSSNWRLHIDLQLMISPVESPIPTSLTNLPPILAALAVWIHSNCIMSIQRSTYSSLAHTVKQVVDTGNLIPVMRDEIYIQIIKQLNYRVPSLGSLKSATEKKPPPPANSIFSLVNILSPNVLASHEEEKKKLSHGEDLLWRLLALCLHHFPPSKSLENYFERFLLERIDFFVALTAKMEPGGADAVKNYDGSFIKDRFPAAQECLRLLHESIFLFGHTSSRSNCYSKSVTDVSHNNRLLFRQIEMFFSEKVSPNLTRTYSNNVVIPSYNVTGQFSMDRISSIVLRNSNQDWENRYKAFARVSGNSKPGDDFVYINKADFVDIIKNLFSQFVNINRKDFVSKYNSSKSIEEKGESIDRIDMAILLFLVLGDPKFVKTSFAFILFEVKDVANFDIFPETSAEVEATKQSLLTNIDSYKMKYDIFNSQSAHSLPSGAQQLSSDQSEFESDSNSNTKSIHEIEELAEVFWDICLPIDILYRGAFIDVNLFKYLMIVGRRSFVIFKNNLITSEDLLDDKSYHIHPFINKA